MSTKNLEQIRLNAVQLIDEGKYQFMNGDQFSIKKNGFELMKQGCQELCKYAKTEINQEYINLAKEKLSLYCDELNQMKQYLAPFEEKQNEEQNKIQNEQNKKEDQNQKKQILKDNNSIYKINLS
ncbi:unnamed protein product [Paramecium sonneborni]|uniref:Uncharacterized protein n=1 Tax=Paramecium sonneborni TaxID=65129 RepID=A0A8S1KXR0_9CILI|nr:unnamed protein product [Paramecium sonneborni]